MQAEPHWCLEKAQFFTILFVVIVALLLTWILLGTRDVPPPQDVHRVSPTAR